jgi:tRNA1(Val) A37 N6-methylase TrmN6
MTVVANVLPTTEDAFLGGRLKLLQPRDGHRAGLDAVLLAAAVRALGKVKVLDAGAGPGIVGLALAARLPDVDVAGVEIEPELVRLAQRNAERSGLAARVRIVEGDLTAPLAALEAKGVVRESFDIVVANPPYLDAEASLASPLALQARASTMPEAGLGRWARFFAAMARPDGMLYLIHRADQLKSILDALDGRFGGLEIMPLYPRASAPAHRLIVRGRKGSRAALTLLPGLAIHGADGQFSPEIERALQGPEALAWGSEQANPLPHGPDRATLA